jgi:hypothetical protein
MDVSILILPRHFLARSSWSGLFLMVKIKALIFAKGLKLRKDNRFKQFSDDLSESMRR